jgi:predicted AlkP superfamily phosphohydrolase/phosphomutase
LAIAALLLLTGCTAETPAEERSSDPPQVVIIALDGLEPSLLETLLAHGRLPNFQRLIDNGSLAQIDCVVGTTSPVVWTTVATGVSPERHGVTDFTIDGAPVTSTLRRVPALWNILPRYGISSAILGWLVTWPAETESGIIVSDRAYWGKFDDKVSPPGVIDTEKYRRQTKPDTSFLKRFTDYPFNPSFESLLRSDPAYAVNFLLQRRLINIFNRDSVYSRIADELLERQTVDLLAVYFQGADYVSHGFWKYFDPEPFREAGWIVDEDEVRSLGGIIPKYYAYLDRLIGGLLGKVDDDALVIALSDHGFGTGLGKYRIKGGDFLSGNHRFKGSLIVSGPQIRQGMEQHRQITHFDILPTVLWALGLPLARDHQGYPLLQFFTDQFIAQQRISFVDTYIESGAVTRDVERSEHDEEILEELKSLGYIE